MRRLVLLFLLLLLVLAGCGGGAASLGTVPNNTRARPAGAPPARVLVAHLTGRESGTARLRSTEHGRKTSVSVRLISPRSGLVAQVAHGRCTDPTELTSTTVLGEVTSDTVSWTLPTPYAELAGTHIAVVLRSEAHAVEACGMAR
jgi:hypothetical protein